MPGLQKTRGAAPLDELLGLPITYRIAVGPWAGQKLFRLQTFRPACRESKVSRAARAGVFSLHACVDTAPNQGEKLDVSRPPVG